MKKKIFLAFIFIFLIISLTSWGIKKTNTSTLLNVSTNSSSSHNSDSSTGNSSSNAVNTYTPQTEYEKKYPITDFVSEDLEATSFLHNQILNAMNNSSQFFSSNNKLQTALKSIFDNSEDFEEQIEDVQYKEPQLISLDQLEVPDATHNFEYTGYLSDGTAVTGNINIGDHALAVSLLNSDGTLNPDLAFLLADDSNAEMLAYQIVEDTQSIYDTSLSPDEGAQEYYNCNIEQLAGSISYHAFMSLYLYEQHLDGIDIDTQVLERTSVVNVSKVDDPDSIVVNRSY